MPLADRVWGYNQCSALVDATLSACCDRARVGFDALPSCCGAGCVAGFKVDFVSGVGGRLKDVGHLEAMARLASFVRFDLLPQPGDLLHKTIDCFTACGSVTLAHKDPKQLHRDIQAVRHWEKTMWILEKQQDKENRTE